MMATFGTEAPRTEESNHTADFSQSAHDYQRIAEAIQFLQQHFRRQPSLAEVAASVHLSEHHFQRLFSRWVGISPKRFLQFLTKEYARQLLVQAGSLLEVTYETGLSSPGRLHDLFVACEAVTPGEFKSAGEGLEITHGFHPGPFGEFLLAVTSRGICGLHFVVNNDRKQALQRLQRVWPRARLVHAPEQVAPHARQIFALRQNPPLAPLHVLVKGTNFQIKVWEALLRIPFSRMVSYSDIARHLGMPEAARAVGNAVASNPIAFVIPCHRVVRRAGDFGNYAGGRTRKLLMLGWEAAHAEGSAAV